MATPDPDYRATFTALSHLLLLDREVRRGHYPSQARLAKALEVSPKTIQRRIRVMQTLFDAPLAYDEHRKGWFYTEPSWRAPNITLRNREVVALELACKAALHFPNAPWADDLRRLFRKLTDGLGSAIQIDGGSAALPVHMGHLPVSPVDPGVLGTMVRAIDQRRTVEIDYHVVDRDEIVARTLEPYLLRAARGVWYAAGHDHLRDEARVFNLSRVRRIQLGRARWNRERHADFDPDEFYRHALFASAGATPERVVIDFRGVAARIVAEFVWHPSQTLTRRSAQRVTLELQVVDHDELRGWILGWGSAAEVKAPASLRTAVAAEHLAAARRYRRR